MMQSHLFWFKISTINSTLTLLETKVSAFKGTFEDNAPFPQVGYLSFLAGSFRVIFR